VNYPLKSTSYTVIVTNFVTKAEVTVQTTMQEKSWREKELVELLGLSRRTIRRIFEDVPGVELIGHRGSNRRRRYTMMLVPDSVLTKVRAQWRER
jgi:transcription initiation factor IIE alpha subunit